MIPVFIVLAIASLTSSVTALDGAPRALKYAGMTFTNERYCPNVTMGSAAAKQSLWHLATTGANFVSVVVTQYQDDVNTTTIYPLPAAVLCTATPNGFCLTASDDEVRETVRFIKQELGLGVMLKLQIDLVHQRNPNYWRGFIGTGMSDLQWDEWFGSYGKALLHYADMAQDLGVDLFSVSCELVTASAKETHWRALIERVRHHFHGRITASANWAPPDGHGEVVDKTWWDAVDVIGVDEYYVDYAHHAAFSNGTFPTVDDLMKLWAPIETQLQDLHLKWNRSVVFTEIGYCSGLNGTCFQNMPSYPPTPAATAETLQAQVNQYEAALAAMSKHSWWEGVFWWNWATDPYFGGEENSCMDPKFKPTEDVLRKWYRTTFPKPQRPVNATPQCRCWL